MVDIDEGQKYILDSLQSQGTRREMISVLSTLEVHFAATTLDFSSFSTEKPELRRQINGSDCGVYMLLYMEGFGRKKIDDFSPEDVQMYRKKLVKDLYDNLDNNPRDIELVSPQSTWTNDHGFIHMDSPAQHQPLSETEYELKNRHDKKRRRSDGAGADMLPAGKRSKQTTETSTPRPRKIVSHFANPVEWKTQMDKPLECATRAYDLVCSEDSKFKQRVLFSIDEDKSFSFTGSVLIVCKNADFGKNYRQHNLPLRVFLSTRTMPIDEKEKVQLKDELKRAANALKHIQMILLPILSSNDWYIYCLNIEHKRRDYLSCSTTDIHESIARKQCKTICSLLCDVLSLAYKNPLNTRDCPVENLAKSELISSTDSGLFAMYFMESYNEKMIPAVNDMEMWSSYNALIMRYLLSHSSNKADLPEELLDSKASTKSKAKGKARN